MCFPLRLWVLSFFLCRSLALLFFALYSHGSSFGEILENPDQLRQNQTLIVCLHSVDGLKAARLLDCELTTAKTHATYENKLWLTLWLRFPCMRWWA